MKSTFEHSLLIPADTENSIFVQVQCNHLTYYCLKTAGQLWCSLCDALVDCVHSWWAVYFGRYTYNTRSCPKCTPDLAHVKWPMVAIELLSHTDDSARVRITLTIRDMILNIRTTPPGRFCLSCRSTVANTEYGQHSLLCEKCNSHLQYYIHRWWLTKSTYDMHNVPDDVGVYTYHLMI